MPYLLLFALGFLIVTVACHPFRALRITVRVAGCLMTLLGVAALILHTTGAPALLGVGLLVWVVGFLF